ncbi:RluA family pseudouridine synthase [Aquirhabdus sp.]|uniref:RluA family pseudouridine synthase n=1 Tax=Aquirhabdus sp. TaxID=2824160 RepID=UPI00396C801F
MSTDSVVPEAPHFTVHYRCDDYLIVNKSSGLLSVPGKGEHLFDSLLTRLQAVESNIKLVHRLDRDTSGLMVFALNIEAQRNISKQFETRLTDKIYQAILLGELVGEGQIDVPVRYEPLTPPLHVADSLHPKAALTNWKAINNFNINNILVTKVLLKPVTGRSHQLRVHSQYIGHAIVGDSLYADDVGSGLIDRLCLHAAALSFNHPVTGERVTYTQDADFWSL